MNTGRQTRRFISPDLFCDNETLLLDRDVAGRFTDDVPKLGGRSFVVRQDDPFDKLADMCGECARHVEVFLRERAQGLSEYKPWLFAAHDVWRPDSVMVNYRRLWKSRVHDSLAAIQENAGAQSREIKLCSSEGVRYAGLALIHPSELATAFEVTRVCSSCVMLLTRRHVLSDDGISQIYDAAFVRRRGVEETSIDWTSLLVRLCPLGDIVFRVCGCFDDPEASIDIFVGTDETRGAVLG